MKLKKGKFYKFTPIPKYERPLDVDLGKIVEVYHVVDNGYVLRNIDSNTTWVLSFMDAENRFVFKQYVPNLPIDKNKELFKLAFKIAVNSDIDSVNEDENRNAENVQQAYMLFSRYWKSGEIRKNDTKSDQTWWVKNFNENPNISDDAKFDFEEGLQHVAMKLQIIWEMFSRCPVITNKIEIPVKIERLIFNSAVEEFKCYPDGSTRSPVDPISATVVIQQKEL